MKLARPLIAFLGALALFASTALAGSAATSATLRAATVRLITAELNRDGATACGVLNAPLTSTAGGRTCAQRWAARSARLLAVPGGARRLRADLSAAATAPVAINGEHGSIMLPYALLNGHSRFYWTNNCWMLTR